MGGTALYIHSLKQPIATYLPKYLGPFQYQQSPGYKSLHVFVRIFLYLGYKSLSLPQVGLYNIIEFLRLNYIFHFIFTYK